MTSRFGTIETHDRIVGREGAAHVIGGVDFDPPNCQGITKAGISCSAPRALGTLFCIGHLRSKGDNVDRG